FEDDVYSVDNAIANSRFRMTGSAALSADISAGFYVEFSLARGARSHQVSQIDDDGFPTGGGILGGAPLGDGIGAAGDAVIDFNQAKWYIDSRSYGRLIVGRTTTATAGIATIDLSNTSVVANAQPFLWGGGFLLRNGIGELGGVTWGQMCGGPGSPATDLFDGSAGPYSVDCGIP